MASSLSSLTDISVERLHKVESKKYKLFLEYLNAKIFSLISNCVDYNKKFQKKFDENLMETLANKNIFCNNYINIFCQKDVYLYEYIDNCQKFDGTSLPEKKNFTAA